MKSPIKWIGQHIWSFISRFRNDVYLEDTSTGTIASGGNLGLDTNNKIVKANVVATVVVNDESDATEYPVVFHDESNNLLDDTGSFEYTPATAVVKVKGLFGFLTLENDFNNGTNDAKILLHNSRGGAAGATSDLTGTIGFQGQNNGSAKVTYSQIVTSIKNHIATGEAGIMKLGAVTSNGSSSAIHTFIEGSGHASANTVDVTIGSGATSVTKLKGLLGAPDDTTIAVTPPICYSTTTIKVLPNEFMINDDTFDAGGVAYATFDDDIGAMGVKVSDATAELITFVKIPAGFMVTHIRVHGSASTSNACKAYRFNYQTGARASGTTYQFDINEYKDITDIVGSATEDLCLEVAPAANTDTIFGATVTIANT